MNESEKRTQRDLQGYLAERIAAEAENIAPQLFSFISGGSREEIDASIALAKQKSAQLVQRALQGQVRPHDQDDPGPTANMQGFGDKVPDVSGWSLEEYGRNRDQIIRRRAGDGVGILGAVGH